MEDGEKPYNRVATFNQFFQSDFLITFPLGYPGVLLLHVLLFSNRATDSFDLHSVPFQTFHFMKNITKKYTVFVFLLLCCFALHAQTEVSPISPIEQKKPKKATKHTQDRNKKVLKQLNFNDTNDYRNASRGLVAPFTDGYIINNETRDTVWNMKHYRFLDSFKPTNAPPEVNPSLWRQEQLNNFAGLFEVVSDKIYQIRGFDLSVMTLIRGDKGWIVIDPLVSAETARAGLDTLHKHVDTMPVTAIIFTHSHIDHYGGVMGVLGDKKVGNGSGEIPVYAPDGFLEHAMSENIIAGTAMGRRASYMYGNTMKNHDAESQVGSGLGKTTSTGQNGVAVPNISINATIDNPTVDTIDGIIVKFWNTPNTEAPTEMMFYFPQFQALCASEEVTHTLHNTYSLRGTQVRDPLAWSQDISDVLDYYGDSVQVMFASHHWPTWGRDTVVHLLKKQRDLYKYINDQTLRLANQGYTMVDIAEIVKLPGSLDSVFANRGYYGTVNHNVKAVYQRYLGWFDGNPANLHPLPPAEAGKMYVEYMGGADSVLAKARRSFHRGEYRWVGMVVNHVVFADPKNMQARYLLADAYEQMGYQAESGPWRNFYLTGARELREPNRVPLFAKVNPVTPSLIDLDNMSLTDYFEYLAIHLNGYEAGKGDKNYVFNLIMTNQDKTVSNVVIRMENGVLNSYFTNKTFSEGPTITLNRSLMNQIIIQSDNKTSTQWFKDAVAIGKATITGKKQNNWYTLLGLLEPFPFWFNIVEPQK